MKVTKDSLEQGQIGIYVLTILVSAGIGLLWKEATQLAHFIEPVIGLLLYSMFCQIPFFKLKAAFQNRSFFKALLVGNFVFIPILVGVLLSIFPLTPILTLGVLLVLLTPCIDYVIVFTHMGKGDSHAVLAATPLLFVVQMLLLPVFLYAFLGKETLDIIAIAPFVQSFVLMIVIPFSLALLTQYSTKRTKVGEGIIDFSGWMPVPMMALTFFCVIASQIGSLIGNMEPILSVLPIYIGFGIVAPFAGLLASTIFKTGLAEKRGVAFSTSTRNSLVVLPLALALPAPDNQLVAVIIVTQTMVEILFELVYIKLIPRFTKIKA
ncbi:arsenic resistance protein [Sphingobacterium sp. MYb382]|uniref:arsenic resistance protein n=1 Tax=Sphingobacterium sp. MYb382 TaxID=2745278 RepID=UPI0030A72633